MSTPRLTPAKASLLMLGIGTASVIGLPGMSGYRPPEGALVGLVTLAEGEGVADAPVGLFDADSLALLEVTHTDGHGRFALQQAPERFHLCVRPDPASGLLPSWALDMERGPLFSIDLIVQPGIPVRVAVTDDEGRPIADADVRGYAPTRRSCTVVARARTDAAGGATLLLSKAAHVGVFGPSPELLSSWSFFHEPERGEELSFELARGRRLHGRVRTEDGNGVEGAVVSAWDLRQSWQWNGYRLSEPDGAFALHAGAGTTEVRALDPSQQLLPTRVVAGPTPTLDLVLERGAPLAIVCRTADGQALPARVWLWSASGGTWSWGSRTDDQGELHVVSSPEGFEAVARPLRRGSSDASAWQTRREGEALVLVRDEPR